MKKDERKILAGKSNCKESIGVQHLSPDAEGRHWRLREKAFMIWLTTASEAAVTSIVRAS